MTEIVLTALHVTVAALLVAFERRRPTATLSWVLAILLMPGVGLVLYLVVGRRRVDRRRRRAASVTARVSDLINEQGVRLGSAGVTDPRTEAMWRLGERLSETPVSSGNRVELIEDAEQTYARMLAAVDMASDHVHVQFYIYRDDTVGRVLRDRLAQKAREGLQVRVLVDAVGSAQLDDRFWDPLVDAGGEAAEFGPLWGGLDRFVRGGAVDLRNHRKLIVIDGREGFLGGMNVGREYWRGEPTLGAWRDAHMRIEGPAVLGMQESFVRDWLSSTGKLCSLPQFFPMPMAMPMAAGSATSEQSESTGAVVQIVAAGPDQEFPALGPLYLQAIASARERVWITTPYFVPTEPIEQCIATAALRGVDVRLLVPARADSRIVGWASRSWFPSLVRAGVRIWTYEAGFIHAKTLLVDRWLAVVGSANLDSRSFHLNYEINAFVYDAEFSETLERRFEGDLESSAELPADQVLKPGVGRRLLLGAARLLSPLL